MSQSERRNAIIDVLCQKRFETVADLAARFGVSTRTIRYDILALSCFYPITTTKGHNGGIRIADWFHLYKRSLSRQQEDLLFKLRTTLSGDDLVVMNSILAQFAISRGADT